MSAILRNVDLTRVLLDWLEVRAKRSRLNKDAQLSILHLTPFLGILTFLIAMPLQNFRVETVQSNGLPQIDYPLGGIGIAIELLGLGLLVFGILFNFSPIRLIGVRRAVSTSILFAAGMISMVFSGYGLLGNFSEWEVHSCLIPQPYPVCSSILWLILDFSVLASIGVALVLAGFVRLRNRKTPWTRGFRPTRWAKFPPPALTN